MLTAAEILALNDADIQKINIPEWGGDFYIRTMTGTERDTWEVYASGQLEKDADINIRAMLAAITLCDEKGNRIFKANQAGELAKKSASALDRIYGKSSKLNKLSEQDLKDIEKN